MAADEGICVRYKIESKIGSGSFGDVYLAKDIKTGEEVAIKVETADVKHQCLSTEYQACRLLQNTGRVPRVRAFETTPAASMMVSELLGPSLEDLLNYCKQRFNLKTVLCLADQMLDCLQRVHEEGLLHRDLKPSNFAIGLGARANTVHLIDFGLVGAWLDPIKKEHKKLRKSRGPVGTQRFMSINTHAGIEQSRRDDLESLGYVLLYFLRGNLPWQSSSNKPAGRDLKNHSMMRQKENVPLEQLCEGLPEEFAIYMRYVRSLSFEDTPDYSDLRCLFKGLFIARGFRDDHYYDWTRQMEVTLRGHGYADAPAQSKEYLQRSSATTKDTESVSKLGVETSTPGSNGTGGVEPSTPGGLTDVPEESTPGSDGPEDVEQSIPRFKDVRRNIISV